jgi:hypothetical protein
VDITRGEHVEKELDLLITRRDEERRAEEGDRRAEEMWAESQRRHDAHRGAENRAAWYGWHMTRANLYERLSREHAATAEGLLGEGAA